MRVAAGSLLSVMGEIFGSSGNQTKDSGQSPTGEHPKTNDDRYGKWRFS